MQRVWWGPLLAPAMMAAEGWARLRPADPRGARKAVKLAARAGDAPRTGRAARRALDALARSPEALAALLEEGARSAPPPRRLDHGLALEALGDVQARLATEGLQPFLIFGTLLGAVRDGAFIPGDSDLDLGVLGADRLPAAPAALSGGALHISPLRRIGGRPAKLEVVHPNGADVEIKAFEPEPDGSTTWHTHAANLVLKKRFPRHFGLAPMPFKGLTVMVPDCAEVFLEWQYGPGWRTPDPTYNMVASGPLHGPEHRAFVWAAGPRALLRLLSQGKVKKPLAMARSLGALFPEEELWPRLAAVLEARLSDRSPAPRDRAAHGSAR